MENAKAPAKEKRTFKSYWINFWYYHKFAFWFFVIFLVCGFLAFDPFSDHTEADYNVGLITTKNWTLQHQQRLARMLEAYADDLNGDGKVKVDVIYMLQPEDMNMLEISEYEAYRMKTYSTFEAGDTMLFLIDNFNLKTYGLAEQLFCRTDDYSTLPDDFKADENTFPLSDIGIPWQQVDGVSQHSYFSRSSSDMYFCYRAVVSALDEEGLERQANMIGMFKRLQNNEPYNAELLAQVLTDAQTEYTSSTTELH